MLDEIQGSAGLWKPRKDSEGGAVSVSMRYRRRHGDRRVTCVRGKAAPNSMMGQEPGCSGFRSI